jgi:hypothetical protein
LDPNGHVEWTDLEESPRGNIWLESFRDLPWTETAKRGNESGLEYEIADAKTTLVELHYLSLALSNAPGVPLVENDLH